MTTDDFDTVSEYFGCIDIIRTLQNNGALQAKSICEDPGVYGAFGPREWDQSFFDVFKDEVDRCFTEAQPFWNGHWDLLYALRHD